MADPNTLIDQLTADPDFLTLPEHEQDEMVEELLGQSASRNPFRQVLGIPLLPLQAASRGMLRGIPDPMKPTAGAIGGAMVGSATRLPFGRDVGAVAGQGLGELATKEPADALPTALGGLGVSGAIGLGGSLFRGVRTLTSRQGRERLAERVLKAPSKFKRVAGRKFGQGLKTIEGTVDVTEDVEKLQGAAVETPNGWKLFEAASRGLPKPLQDVLNGTRSAVLTAEEATQLRVAVNDIPRLSRELARATPEYKNLERPFVEFASNVGKKMGQLPGKRALDVQYAGAMRDVERVTPFTRRESQLAFGGTPVFRRGAGKLVPDLRATGASGRVFSSKLKRDIRDVRNVKRVGATVAGVALKPFLPSFVRREVPGADYVP